MSSHYKCRVAAKSGPVRTCRLPRAPRLPSACQTLRQEVRDSLIAIHVHAAPPRAAPVRRSTQDPALLTLILHPSISQKASSRATPRALAAPPRAMATETLPVSPRFPSRTAASVGRWGQRPEVDVRPSSSPKGKKVRDQSERHLQVITPLFCWRSRCHHHHCSFARALARRQLKAPGWPAAARHAGTHAVSGPRCALVVSRGGQQTGARCASSRGRALGPGRAIAPAAPPCAANTPTTRARRSHKPPQCHAGEQQRLTSFSRLHGRAMARDL